MSETLDPAFFSRCPTVCAEELVGCIFRWNGCAGRIVETEAYAAAGDEACHTFSRPSSRLFVENQQAGDAYVYLNYGVHWLFNVLVKDSGDSMPGNQGFVLIRALEPLEGLRRMRRRRGCSAPGNLCSGPGKLTQAFAIDKNVHNEPVARAFFLPTESIDVVASSRVGISRSVDLPWRFTMKNSPFVSRPRPE